MSTELVQTELPVALRGGSDTWDQPAASTLLIGEWFSEPVSPPTGPTLKYWTGSAWAAKPLKWWNGSTWVNSGVLKRWNDSAWVTV